MSEQSQLSTEIASVQQAVTDAGNRIASELQQLQDKINSGSGVTQADLDNLNSIAAELQDANFGQPQAATPQPPVTP